MNTQHTWIPDEGINDEWFRRNNPRAGSSSVLPVAPDTSPDPVTRSFQNVGAQSTPPPGIGLDPGYIPDYKQLVLSDPAYLQFKNNAVLDQQSAAARRRAALQALVVRYGGLGQLNDAYGDIDQTTLDLAGRNEFADVKRVQRNYEDSVRAYVKALAARRGIGSSELGYGLKNAEMNRAATEYDLGQQFSSAAQQAINDYLNMESALRRDELAALQAAMMRQFQLNPPRPGTSAHLDPDWATKYGVPVYIGPDGSLYNRDGSRYAPRTASATPSSWDISYDPQPWWQQPIAA